MKIGAMVPQGWRMDLHGIKLKINGIQYLKLLQKLKN